MTTEATASPRGRKLIEVALPLEAINRASAREKSIRHGHPSTLHLWWARRPLAACRAVLFAQLVDDPSARPGEFPTEEAQAKERERLFRLIERMVVWENTTDEVLFRQAHEEILRSTGGNPPPILDPFAGGGSIPLEAQRLGLEAHASDLNPVAALINKALIEIPPKWAGRPPVFPGAAESRLGEWPRASGLAEDVRRYGQWMRDEAERRIGHLYPRAKLADGVGRRRHRVDLGPDGEVPESGVRDRDAALQQAVAGQEEGQGGLRRAAAPGRPGGVRHRSRPAPGADQGRRRHRDPDRGGVRRLRDRGSPELRPGRGQGEADGGAAHGRRRRGQAAAALPGADPGARGRGRDHGNLADAHG
jgi:hypothetical protein